MASSEPELPDWPKKGFLRRALLSNMERYLTVGEEVTRIRSYAQALPPSSTVRMPLALRQVVSLMAQRNWNGRTLTDEIDDRSARAIWQEMTARAPRLEGETGGWEAFVQVASLVAEGMTYPRLAFDGGVPLTDESLAGSRPRRIPQWLEGIQLWLISGAYMTKDLRSLAWLARQPLRGGFRGLCRHYSRVVQALFDVMKRATGRFEECFVLTVVGYTSRWSLSGHAWTWYVNVKRNSIVAADLTGADWLMDRGGAESIVNEGFDATRWSNVSAFLSELFVAYAHEESMTYRSPEIQKAMSLLIEPGTVRGLSLLHNLCYQPGLHEETLRRIVHYLEGKEFSRVFPGWKRAISIAPATRARWLASKLGSAETQLSLLGHVLG